MAAYITAMAAFLPGQAIANEEIEDYLGRVHNKPSRLKNKILKSNGIQTRHYALDKQQQTTYQNSEMAALAGSLCLKRAALDNKEIEMLAVATTQGDLPLPGMASLVQSALQLPPCEIISTHGVCASGIMALKAAANCIRLKDKENALVCASELASRLLKRQRYEMANEDAVNLESEFLRWMLSDGAAALLIQAKPRENKINLRIDWIEVISYASDFALCMSCGTTGQAAWTPSNWQENGISEANQIFAGAKSWQDYDSYAAAEKDGALLIRQNLRVLEGIVRVGVEGFLRLISAGKIEAAAIDHFVCHYSSHHFRGEILKLFRLLGCHIPEEKWFTNLYSKGNTGCAAMFIALEELFASGKIKAGETIFCVVPESGRFCTAYIKMTAVEG